MLCIVRIAAPQQQQQPAAMRRSLDAAQRLTAPSLDWESPASPGRGWELNEFSSLKGTASGLGFSKLQNSVTASGRTTSVEDARSVNRHSQTRSGGAGERRSPAESSFRPYLTLEQQQRQYHREKSKYVQLFSGINLEFRKASKRSESM